MPFDGQDVVTSDLAVLRQVRAKLENRDNWCQGSLNQGNAYCAIGWIYVVLGLDVKNGVNATMHFLVSRNLVPALPLNCLDRYLSDSIGAVARYNDRDLTTHQDILDLFDRAIAKLEAMGA